MLSSIVYWPMSYAQSPVPDTISLNNVEAFQEGGKDWMIASNAAASFDKAGAIETVSGEGVIVNKIQRGTDLVTKRAFGDLDLELDFMMAKDAASGVYLQGRYKIQLADSWTNRNPTFADLGGIGQEVGNSFEFNGKAPFINVARAPGLWQHLRVKFRAPTFDADGVKKTNALFEEIYLNGTLVQAHVEINAPIKGSMFENEEAIGPLVFENNEGSVAFRHISVHPIRSKEDSGSRRIVNPILLNPKSEAYTLRSFLKFGNKKRTHVVSVGSPNQMNYAYDVKQGALLEIWRGPFMDVTAMWEERGEPQLAKPLGSVLPLSAAPFFAILTTDDTAWPDSIAFDDMHNNGYTLDNDRIPTFTYEIAGYTVSDKIFPQTNGESLRRELIVTNPPDDLYCRIAAATIIESLGKGVYAVGDRSYYVKVNERFKPLVRKTPKGQELIVVIKKTTTPLTYSIIW